MDSLALAIALMAAGFPQASGSQAAGDAAAIDVVQASPDFAQRMTVEVRLGDHGPFRFLVDTGAQNTVVSSALADRLALPAGAGATVVGIAGRQAVSTVEIDELALGRRSFYGLVAPVLESHYIGVDGIVGLDGLQGQRVLMDFRHNLLAIDDAAGPSRDSGYEIVVTARRRSGQLVMTDARIDGVRVDVVIDTGAETSVGNRALQQALARRGLSAQVLLTSVTGQQALADVGLGRKLDLGGMNFANVKLAYTDSPAFGALGLERRPALLLGMEQLRLFDRVAIDFARRKILFDGKWDD